MISRFCFNISIYKNLKNILKIFFFRDINYDEKLKKKLSIIYNSSEFYFFDYGRTAFYEILSQIKTKTNKRKVLINSLTLFEIINVIIYSGFEPVFIDTKKNSFQTSIDLNDYNKEINNIAVIVITHLNGANENIINIKKQIDNHNKNEEKIYLVEDCAVSFGSKFNEENVGCFGDYSFLSFNIMKNITCYTGGTLIDNDKNILSINKLKYMKLSKLGVLKKTLFIILIQFLNSIILFPIFFKFINYSYKNSFNFFLKRYRADFEVKIENNFPLKFSFLMHPFQKKILITQFDDFKEKQLSRIKKSKIYYNNLNEIDDIEFPQNEFTLKNTFLDFPILCKTLSIKNNLFNYLIEKKIDIKNYYYKNCAEEPIYNSSSTSCPNSMYVSQNILMLPVHEKINEQHQHLIINEIRNFFKENTN